MVNKCSPTRPPVAQRYSSSSSSSSLSSLGPDLRPVGLDGIATHASPRACGARLGPKVSGKFPVETRETTTPLEPSRGSAQWEIITYRHIAIIIIIMYISSSSAAQGNGTKRTPHMANWYSYHCHHHCSGPSNIIIKIILLIIMMRIT